MKITIYIIVTVTMLLLIFSLKYIEVIMLFLYGYDFSALDIHTVDSVAIKREIYTGKIFYSLSILMFSILSVYYSSQMKNVYKKHQTITLVHILHIILLTGLILWFILSLTVGRIRII